MFIFIKNQASKLFREMTRLTSDNGQPNINQVWDAVKDIEAIRLNIKNFGYFLGKNYQHRLNNIEIVDKPVIQGLGSKPTTQADMESKWFRYWCNELHIAPIYHRKLWEYAFVLQCLHENNLLLPGKSGLGFGCGEEPVASYFASKGINAHVTDLEIEKVVGTGWLETNQHASNLEAAFHPAICSREKFEAHVSHEYVDMNNIPSKLSAEYDFCWSICAMEHLGSIEKGLNFVEKSLDTLKPGGIAIHTTEYNYLSEDLTIDNWPTVLFLKKHLELLARHLKESGHQIFGPSFDVGDGVLDRFIDIPPYSVDEGFKKNYWTSIKQDAFLKLSIGGFACTCFGIVIRKREGETCPF